MLENTCSVTGSSVQYVRNHRHFYMSPACCWSSLGNHSLPWVPSSSSATTVCRISSKRMTMSHCMQFPSKILLWNEHRRSLRGWRFTTQQVCRVSPSEKVRHQIGYYISKDLLKAPVLKNSHSCQVTSLRIDPTRVV